MKKFQIWAANALTWTGRPQAWRHPLLAGALLLLWASLSLRVAAGCGPVSIQRDGAFVQISWAGPACRLQGASSLNPPVQWAGVAGAVSPF